MKKPNRKLEVIPVEEYARVLGRHFARTILTDLNPADGSSVENVERKLDALLEIVRREIVAEFASHRAAARKLLS